MPDKRLERYHFAALRAALPELPSGDPDEPEPPDFVLTDDRGRLGIELTTFHLPTRDGEQPYQERQSLKERIVRMAERQHHEWGGPPLYVSVFFHLHVPIAKKDSLRMAQEIAVAVFNASPVYVPQGQWFQIPWERRPPFTYAINFSPSVDGEDKLWHPDAGGWVADVTSQHITDVIRAKRRKVAVARTRCDRLWLVIVNDFMSRTAPAEISQEARSAVYEATFDRLIWLIPYQPPTAMDLSIGPCANRLIPTANRRASDFAR